MAGRPTLPRRLAAEALGTFGLVVAVVILAVGHLSGAHLNPAVTAAFAAARDFPPGEVAPYVAAQVVGALLASAALRGLFGLEGGLGATHPDHVGQAGALILETGLTAVLMVVILAVATDTRAVGSLAALAIGGTIALEALVMGPITGASMNAARSLAPTLVAGDGADLWLYLAGPVAGALVGAAIYAVLRETPGAGRRDAAPALIEQEETAR